MSHIASSSETLAASPSAPVQVPAWEDPAQPRLTAMVQPPWEVLGRPGKLFTAMPREGSLGPLIFGLMVVSFGLLAGFYLELLLSSVVGQELQGLPAVAHVMNRSTHTIVGLMILTPGLILVSLLAGSGCLWDILRSMGVAADFPAALRINCDTQGTFLAAIAPVWGSLAAII